MIFSFEREGRAGVSKRSSFGFTCQLATSYHPTQTYTTLFHQRSYNSDPSWPCTEIGWPISKAFSFVSLSTPGIGYETKTRGMVPGVESWLRRRLALCLTISNKIGLDLLYRNLVKKGIEPASPLWVSLTVDSIIHAHCLHLGVI